MRRCGFAVVAVVLIAQLPWSRHVPGVSRVPLAIESTIRGLPLAFERNTGQFGDASDFGARAGGMKVSVGATGAHFISSSRRTPIRLRFPGASERAQADPLDERPGRIHYLLGNDPSKWRRDVPTFGKVRYRDIYPGIDVVYYGNGSQLEYDLVVSRRIALDAVRLTFDGSMGVEIAPNGDVVVSTADGELRQPPPTVFRLDDAARTPLVSRYRRIDSHTVTFDVDAPEDTPIVVDPVLSYASYFGGSDYDTATSIARDAAGNTYVAGYTRSADLPTTQGSLSATAPGGSFGVGRDAFVIKLNAAGSQLIYSTYLGGMTGGDGVNTLAVDSAGAVYVGGSTYSPDFPTTPGAFDRTCGGSGARSCGDIAHFPAADGFLAKLSPAGNALMYSTFLGGGGQESVEDIELDTSGNAYAVGTTTSSEFPSTPSALDPTCDCGSFNAEAYVVKLNAAGSALEYGTFFKSADAGAGTAAGASAVAVDSAGRAYVLGTTNSPNFPTTPDAFQPKLAQGFAGGDAFVAILNSTGSGVEFGSFLGGNFYEFAGGIGVAPNGAVAVTGTTWSRDFPTLNATQPDYTGNQNGDWATGNAFITVLNPTHQRVYSTYYGGKGTSASDVIITALLNVYIAGSTRGGQGVCDNGGGPTPCLEAYFALFDAGGRFIAASTLGGTKDDGATAMSLTTSGQLTLVGYTSSSDFPTVRGLQSTYRGGSQDAFIATFSPYALKVFKNGNGLVVSSPEGIQCGAFCSTGYGTDTVTLTATPDPGWAFGGWSGDDDCRDGRLTMLNDRSCTATFVRSLGVAATPGALDLNGDGGADVFTYDARAGVWSLEFGNRNNQFGSTGQVWSPEWSIYAADVNADGLADFFLYGPDGTWVKAINNGRGDFNYFSSRWDRGWTITVIDLDADRRSDLFLYNIVSGVWVKAYSANPTPLADFRYVSGTWAPGWSVTPAELNGDGRTDLFLYNSHTGGWMRAVNDSDASFSTTTGSWSSGWEVHDGDFNGDGRSDIFLYSQATGQWFVCTNNGTGFDYATGAWDRGWNLTRVELDADGRADLFLYSPSTGAWVEAFNIAGVDFRYAAGQWSPGWRLTATDFNADRRTDLLLYNQDTGQWFQAINQGFGVFAYGTGFWEKNLTVVASMPRVP